MLQSSRSRAFSALLLSLPILLAAYARARGIALPHGVFGADLNLTYFLLATAVLFWAGGVFYRSAFAALRRGAANADVLVALSTTTAYLYSAIGFFFFGAAEPPWETSVTIVTMILFGRYLTEVLADGVGAGENADSERQPDGGGVSAAIDYASPAIVGIGIIAFILWYYAGGASFQSALFSMVAVLIAAGPSALRLSIEVPRAAGFENGRCFGIFLRDTVALDRIVACDSVVFGKTGVLTMGEPAVTDFVVIDQKLPLTDALHLAASLEAASPHPIGRAIAEAGQKSRTRALVHEFRVIPGAGVSGVVEGKRVEIGNFMTVTGVLSEIREYVPEITRLSQEGKTVLLMCVKHKPIAVIALADPLRPFAAEIVGRIVRMGKRIMLMTGDSEKTARAIAATVGIVDVAGGLSPEGKAEFLSRLAAKGRRVACVGSASHDIPVFSIGVSIVFDPMGEVGAGEGDVILKNGDLRAVVGTLTLARQVGRVIRQNLAFAFAYSAVALFFASGAYRLVSALREILPAPVPPEVAAAAMVFSHLAVIAHAKLLGRYDPIPKR